MVSWIVLPQKKGLSLDLVTGKEESNGVCTEVILQALRSTCKIYIERSTCDKSVHRIVWSADGIREGFQNCRKEYDTADNGLQASGNGRDFKITSVVTRHSRPSWSIHISGQPILYLKWKRRDSIQIGNAHTYTHYQAQSSQFQLTRKKRNNIWRDALLPSLLVPDLFHW